jgi:hypothetical protein
MSIALDGRTQLRPHTGLGISSFTLGVISLIAFVALTGYAGLLQTTGHATEATNTLVGVGVLLIWIANLVGIGLGIAGAVQHCLRKVFPTLGLVFNVGNLLLSAAIVAVGISMH